MALKLSFRVAFLLTLVFSCLANAADVAATVPPPSIDRGFRLLYDLNFTGAQQVFGAWRQQHPDDPMGPVGEAAEVLFSEFDRLGILEGQFYEDDAVFAARKKLTANPAARDRLNAALDQAETRAKARLAKDPKDRDALFAMTLSAGLKADYAALIEKRNLASLGFTRDSTSWAEKLLAVDPLCYDAHLATGISQYIIGSKPAPIRWILRLGGVSGDKQAGIADLQLAADRGRYLAPFARILLAIAYVRDKDAPRARLMLASLRDEFPGNPLFTRELQRLNSGN